ncbi:hypothetical protein GCM10023084_26820 [Streptomyces lacrimifluminis]|uniref:Glycosyltransferase n=1 Tax=Streptomyces lacrimifluminis TaxID=1500077 RepID=A0A917NT17_9ACTN|nr:hypothetical protein GCM10012282_23440 [Streptomyces lacrimifluminis]
MVPVYNEAHVLADSVGRLHACLVASFPFPFPLPLPLRITVADNAGTDATCRAANDLPLRLPHVHAVRPDAKGRCRGRALKHGWSRSTADVVRGPEREFVSRSYNALPKIGLVARFSDPQCGFEAVRTDAFRASEPVRRITPETQGLACADKAPPASSGLNRRTELAPYTADNDWFPDTGLLVLAQRNRLGVHEVPVDRFDAPGSRVGIVHTTPDGLRGTRRMLRAGLTGRSRIAVPQRGPVSSPIGAPQHISSPAPSLEYAS